MNISWQNDINARSKIDFQGCMLLVQTQSCTQKHNRLLQASLFLTPGNNFLVNFGEKN